MHKDDSPIESIVPAEEERKLPWKAPTIEELPYSELEAAPIFGGVTDLAIYTGAG
jgi:hypothetical protein